MTLLPRIASLTMERTTGALILITIYLLGILVITLWQKKKETTEEFLIGERKIGLIQTIASTFSVIGGILLVGQAALAFDLGFGAMWLWLGLASGMIGLGFGLHNVKKLADSRGYLTISDYIHDLFGRTNGTLSAIILFLAFFALLIGQFIAGGELLSSFLGISYPSAVVILGITTLAYVLRGGFKVIIRTDFLQFLIVGIVSIVALLNVDFSSYEPSQLSLGSLDPVTALSLLLIGFFTIFAAADIWQRIFAAKDVQTAKRASFITGGAFFVFGIILSLIGITAKNTFPGIDSGDALFYGLQYLAPQGALSIMIVMVLAAIMSTIDTELFYLSSSIAKDFGARTQKNSTKIKRVILYSLISLTIVAIGIAIFVSNIILLAFALLSLTLCVAPSVIASFFWKLHKSAVLLSMSTGFVAFGLMFFTNNLTPDNASITLPAAIIALAVGQLVFLLKRKLSHVNRI